jgi:hypothetical protein
VPQVRTPFGAGLYGAFDPADTGTWAGTPLVLEETTGSRRRLELRGQALPAAPLSIPLSRRATVVRYPGQRGATTHVLGVDEGSTSMGGRWLSQELAGDDLATWREGEQGPPQAVRSAEDLREILYDLVRAGSEIRVEWAGVRRFTASLDFDASHFTRGDIAWSLSVEWGGEGEFVPLPVADTVETGALTLMDTVSEWLDVAAYPANVVLDVADFMDTQLLAVEGAVSELRDVVNLYVVGEAAFLRLSGRLVGIAERIRAAARSVRDEVLALPSAVAWTGLTSGSPSGYAEQSAVAEWLARTKRYSTKAAAEAARYLTTLEGAAVPDVARVWVTVGDTDLRYVAQQVWGRPSEWTVLADYNGLQGSAVPAGTTLLIPQPSRG